MAEPTSEKHYEEKFEFPLWKMIKQYAEEKDTSYVKAAGQVMPEFQKSIRYRDTEFEDEVINKRKEEIAEFTKRVKQGKGKGD